MLCGEGDDLGLVYRLRRDADDVRPLPFDHLAVVGVEVGYPVPLGEHLQAALAPPRYSHDLGVIDGIVGSIVAVGLAKRAWRLLPFEQTANASSSHDGYPVL